MSVQFGRWSFEGRSPASDYFERVNATLAPFGPDTNESYAQGGVKILYRAFHTTKESWRETQPHIAASGVVITWDGRLDNRTELISELRDSVCMHSTDVSIIAAAYERWSTDCFAKLIGDWALSIWNPDNHSLILAKDPLGPRRLYYSIQEDQITWSTILDPLILFAGKTFSIDEEYIAGWLSYFPAAHLTPYVGIHSVPPSSWVLLDPGKHTITKYWDFDPSKKIRYGTDAEYEEHFRAVFGEAVDRRLRSDRPILAELSGGMDSSSIVCIADAIIANGGAETPRLATISWYDKSNPNWDDHLYFTKVEEKRGCTGCHIDIGSLSRKDDKTQIPFLSPFESDHFAATPNLHCVLPQLFKRYAAYMRCQGYRVVLSGLGGDSVTGSGIPTPTPELQNLLAKARLLTLIRQLNAWARKMRKPWIKLLWEAVREFLPLALAGASMDMRSAPWFHPCFVHRNQAPLCRYPSRVKLFGSLPSFQQNISNVNGERRLLASGYSGSELLSDLRYPYLDRSFLEFMYAVPREQIVRVGQRRSLMRRALAGIVPEELLNRKRNTVVPHPASRDNPAKWTGSAQIRENMVSSSIGIMDANRFWETLQKAGSNVEIPTESLVRTVRLESWLRHLVILGLLTNPMSTKG